MKTRTPSRMYSAIRRLTKNLGLSGDPRFVPVAVDAPGKMDDCFNNVKGKIETSEGSIAYGWAIWEWPKVLVEAEFHAIWVSPTGNECDVTPRGDTRTLFLNDPKRSFTGRQIDNVRLPLRDDALIHGFISLACARFCVLNAGDRATRIGEVVIPANEIKPILVLLSAIGQMLDADRNEKSACFCGSERQYRKCCRAAVEQVCRQAGIKA